MNLFSIHSDSSDVEALMNQVRTQLQERLRAECTDPNMSGIEAEFPMTDQATKDMEENRVLLNNAWNVDGWVFLPSRRPGLGRVITLLRRGLRFAVWRLASPLKEHWTSFNAHLVRHLNGVAEELQHQAAEVSRLTSQTQQLQRQVKSQIQALSDLKALLSDLQMLQRLERLEKKEYQECAFSPQSLAPRFLNYQSFEQRFRGSQDQVRAKQIHYVGFFKGCPKVLDIGCGRGEFIKLLREQEIPAYGVDMDRDMVAECKNSDLEVYQNSGADHLVALADNSLGGIFMSHVAEHLPSPHLFHLLQLCFLKLQPGAPIVLETPNIFCLSVSGHAFWSDPFHIRPVHPELLCFLLESVGFSDIKVEFSNPFPETERTSQRFHMEELSPQERINWEILKENFQRINDTLWGNRDFSVVARKPSTN